MLIPCADSFALELSWSLLKRVVGGKTIDRLSQEERKLRALHPLLQAEEAAKHTCSCPKRSCSFACGPVRGCWVPLEFCFQPNCCLESSRPVALGRCWEWALSSRPVPMWILCLDLATRSTLIFGETGEGRSGREWTDNIHSPSDVGCCWIQRQHCGQ